MSRLIYLGVVIVFCLCSCSKEPGKAEVDFTKTSNVFLLKSKSDITTGVKLKFSGKLDCDLKIRISNEMPLTLKAGDINEIKKFECYENGKKITILSDSCHDRSNLVIYYEYSSSYFGQK